MGKEKVFVSDIPELLEEWDYEKNEKLGYFPNRMTHGSGKKVWWLCNKCHHSWQSTIGSRSAGNGCPKCALKTIGDKKRKASLNNGNNTLAKINPDLCSEWDYEKNHPFRPTDYSPNSHKKIWWKCNQCGYSWQAFISGRNNGNGCPACSNQVLWEGHNDLETVCPELSLEWCYEKNEKSPKEYVAGGHTKVWWICSNCGHEWKTSIVARINGTGCPKCSFALHTSLPEQCIYHFISLDFPTAINSYRPDWLDGKEIDIFIPEFGIGIEYDGGGWHQDTEKDTQKTALLKSRNIQLIRIREPNCPEINDGSIVISTQFSKTNVSFLQRTMVELYGCLSVLISKKLSFSGNISEKYFEILEQLKEKQDKKSLAAVLPEILDEWDYEKNQGLSPSKMAANSNYKVFWKCRKCGYSWQSSIDHRRQGYGCARCAGQVVWQGNNDFATKHPELLYLWNYNKNVVLPTEVTANAHKKIWWLCNKCGGEWQTYVYNVSSGHGCPFCSGQILKIGYNDLATRYPSVVKEWDYTKNIDLKPNEISSGSRKKIWWICEKCSFEWQAAISSRINGRGCPQCAKKKISMVRSKAVCQYSLDNQLIAKFPSAIDAQKATGAKSISACCKHKRKTSGGYIWRYADDEEKEK